MRRSSKKKYAPGKIHPFGGKIDKNENPFDGAVREIREELGIEIENLMLEAVVTEIQPDDKKPENWMIFYFSADYKKGEIMQTEEGEILYLTPLEIKSADLFPSVKSIIDKILNPDDGTVFTTNCYDGFESGMKEISKNSCVIK